MKLNYEEQIVISDGKTSNWHTNPWILCMHPHIDLNVTNAPYYKENLLFRQLKWPLLRSVLRPLELQEKQIWVTVGLMGLWCIQNSVWIFNQTICHHRNQTHLELRFWAEWECMKKQMQCARALHIMMIKFDWQVTSQIKLHNAQMFYKTLSNQWSTAVPLVSSSLTSINRSMEWTNVFH